MEKQSYEAERGLEKERWDAEQARKGERLLRSGKVIIAGIDIPFWDLVVLLVKISLAAIPAAFIVMAFLAFITPFLAFLFRWVSGTLPMYNI